MNISNLDKAIIVLKALKEDVEVEISGRIFVWVSGKDRYTSGVCIKEEDGKVYGIGLMSMNAFIRKCGELSEEYIDNLNDEITKRMLAK